VPPDAGAGPAPSGTAGKRTSVISRDRTKRRKSSLVGLAIAILTAAVAALVLPALSQAEALKPYRGFGSVGKLILSPSGRPGPQGIELASRADGGFFVLADRLLSAYGPDGSPLSGFGQGGRVDVGSLGFRAAGVAVAPDGDVLVGGTAEAGEQAGPVLHEEFPIPDAVQDQTVAVYRYLPDGEADASFGDGGHAYPALGLPPPTYRFANGEPPFGYESPVTSLSGLTVDGEGQVIVTGDAVREVFLCPRFPHDGETIDDFVARLDKNGEPDASLAETGLLAETGESADVELQLLASGDLAYWRQPVSPCEESERPPKLRFLRLPGMASVPNRGSRSLDSGGVAIRGTTTFDHSGRRLSIREDHGGIFDTFTLDRLKGASGSPDKSFGTRGGLIFRQRHFIPEAVAPAPGSGVLVAGTTGVQESALVLCKVSEAGTFESSFGRDGCSKTPMPGDLLSEAGILSAPNGEVVAFCLLTRQGQGTKRLSLAMAGFREAIHPTK
jgi:hypothetical protein